MRELEIRDRNIPGTDEPLAAEITYMFGGETLDILVPFSQIMPASRYVESVASIVKSGSGVSLSALAIDIEGKDVTAKVSMAVGAGQRHLLGVQATLSSGEVWEINVPVERMEPT